MKQLITRTGLIGLFVLSAACSDVQFLERSYDGKLSHDGEINPVTPISFEPPVTIPVPRPPRQEEPPPQEEPTTPGAPPVVGVPVFPSPVVPVPAPPPVEEEPDFETKTFTQTSGTGKLDILVVQDTSISMHHDRWTLGTRFRSLGDQLNGVDWQLGMTTTNRGVSHALNGGLVKLPNSNQTIIKSGDSRVTQKLDDHLSMLQCNEGDSLGWVQNPCTLSDERPLSASIDTLNKMGSGENKLHRPDADLAIVYITDADETAGKDNVESSAADVIRAYRNNVKREHLGMRAYGVYVKPGDSHCFDQQRGNFTEPASAYAEKVDALVQQTGGQSVSICDSSFDSLFTAMAEDLENNALQSEFRLDHVPNPDSVVVELEDGSQIPWELDGQVIRFAEAPAAGVRISVSYTH